METSTGSAGLQRSRDDESREAMIVENPSGAAT